jgi:FkbM family methyltransferase
MNARHYLRSPWKASMRNLLKLYSQNYSMYIHDSQKGWDNRFMGVSAGLSSGRPYYSEHGQDAYVLTELFSNKRDGVFVDIGANHPTDCSNSYLLEQHGWHGLAVEPQEAINKLWAGARKTPCLACVVGAESKVVTFVEGTPDQHGLSGVEGYNKATDSVLKKQVFQRRLEDILNEYNLAHIDYLSIDVEGYEMNVLEGIDFSRVNVHVIGVENDLPFKFLPLIGKRLGFELGQNKIRRFLKSKGYKYVARIVSDDFFVKAEMTARA